MPNTKRLHGYAHNAAGTPLVGLTVNVYRVDNGQLAASATTLDANPPEYGAGYWRVDGLPTEYRHRAEIVLNGSQKLMRHDWSGEVDHLTVAEALYMPDLTGVFVNGNPITGALLPTTGGTINGNLSVTNALSANTLSITGSTSLPAGTTIGGGQAWAASNDGTGSGLDADMVDGQHSSAFAAADHTHAGQRRSAIFTYQGDGLARQVDTTLGVRPRYVTVMTLSGPVEQWHLMYDGATPRTFRHLSGSLTEMTNTVYIIGSTATDDLLQMTGADMNTSGTYYVGIAWE